MESVPGDRRHATARVALIPPAGAFLAAAIAVAGVARGWNAATFGGAAGVREALMVPATAAGLLLAAGALLLVQQSRAPAARQLGRILAGLTTLIGLLASGLYIVGWGGIADVAAGSSRWAQRPGPTTALGFMFVGTSLLAASSRRNDFQRLAGACAAATLVIALTGLVGHAYGASVLYGLNRWGGTAISTVIALSALAVGVLFTHPRQGVAAVATSDGAGGHLMRRLMPAALVAPLLLGWLALTAQERGLFDVAFGAALLVVSLIVLLAALIVRQATVLHAIDAERERLLARERQASEQVSRILESITDAFFAVDREWRFTYVNREAERLLQRPRDELLGRLLWDEFAAAIGTAFEREYVRAMAEQKTARFEEYFAPLDAWFEVRAFPNVEGLSVYFTNVTARRVAEERLRESEERYRLLADMIPQHIWTTNPDGYHTYFSRRWYEFTGSTPGETQGDGWLDLLHPDDRERTIAEWEKSLRTGERYSVEYRFRNTAGEYRWFWGQALPQRNEDGEIVRWFGTLTDISERRRLGEERERLLHAEREARAEADRRREELERVTESRTRLMRGFSHDLKNPLGAADGHAQLLEDGIIGDLSERQRDSVGRIRRSIHTSLRLINDLLELARAEAGQIETECVATDVTQAAREVADDFRAQAAAAGLAISVNGPESLQAETDPTRLRQILANLVSNAVKYAPNGEATLTADMKRNGDSNRPGSWVVVSVSDNGPGIPEDKRDMIFHEFTRLDPEAQAGAGVGLAISRRIAQLMGGDLTVESEVGRGSTFTLWLPPA
ncbi:MAG TPA: ATP-binding protein [Longimicrobiales bacterium]|nr:ATP-binding protein [Longimicrobiales bacterium]